MRILGIVNASATERCFFMYFILQGRSEGDNEQRSLDKDKVFIRKVADTFPKVYGKGSTGRKRKPLSHFNRL